MTMADVYSTIEDAIRNGDRCVIGNHNLHSVYLYHHDADMRKFYAAARYAFIDGMPIVLLGKLLRLPLGSEHRLTAADWFPPLIRKASERRWRVFLLGSRPGVAERAAVRLLGESPELQLSTAHGYFDATLGGSESEAILQRIRNFQPHILIVGMGMPRQERWIHENLERLEANVIMNQGAVMDYVAGAVPIPPRWLGSIGFEWLGRLVSEPRRLWRRYLLEPWSLLPALLNTLAARLSGHELLVDRRGPGRCSPDDGESFLRDRQS
jgi:N-acetylglucosaminyldiphosphoundecaprenol N-acetyl-beta-D-mannosaminyltransferase